MAGQWGDSLHRIAASVTSCDSLVEILSILTLRWTFLITDWGWWTRGRFLWPLALCNCCHSSWCPFSKVVKHPESFCGEVLEFIYAQELLQCCVFTLKDVPYKILDRLAIISGSSGHVWYFCNTQVFTIFFISVVLLSYLHWHEHWVMVVIKYSNCADFQSQSYPSLINHGVSNAV